MIRVDDVASRSVKSDVSNHVLRALSGWFGNEESIKDYVAKVEQMPFYAAYDDDQVVGFVALKEHNDYTSEICVMGVLREYHRQGVGSKLIAACEADCQAKHKTFLTVKTLDSSAEYEPYARTLDFYRAMGFAPLEVFPLYWDKDNPCLLLAKYIGGNEHR